MLECIFSRAHDFIYLVQSAAESVSLSQNPRHPAVVSLTPPHLWWPPSDLQQRCLWHHHLSQLLSVWYCLCLSLYYHKHRYQYVCFTIQIGKWVTPVIVYIYVIIYLIDQGQKDTWSCLPDWNIYKKVFISISFSHFCYQQVDNLKITESQEKPTQSILY